jgi:ankyrin repeat domain-containing protein 50
VVTDDPKTRAKREAVLRWYKSDPEQNQKSSREAREPNTGTWVFEDERLRQWKERTSKDDQLLWLHGIPGTGKTVLCSTTIDHVQSYCADRPVGEASTRRSVYYYFEFSDNHKQSMANLLKSCIFQLISTNPGISKAAEDLYDDRYMGANEPSLRELLGVLLAEVATYGTLLLMIDALDECPKQERKIFLEKIVGPILGSNIKLLLTSRKETDIERGLPASVKTIAIQDSVVDVDIRTHVSSVVSQDSTLRAMPLKIREEILDGIVSGARGM